MQSDECRMQNEKLRHTSVLREVILHSAFCTPHLTQASALVLRSPVIRSPSFHWPRFLRISRRSKRFRTLRFPPRVAAARRLRCCDIVNRLLVVGSSSASQKEA